MTERPLASCPVTIRRIFFSRGLRVWLRAGVVFFICRIPIAICASVPMRRRLGASATAIEYSSDPSKFRLEGVAQTARVGNPTGPDADHSEPVVFEERFLERILLEEDRLERF